MSGKVGKKKMLQFLGANSEQDYFHPEDHEAYNNVAKIDLEIVDATKKIRNAKATVERTTKARDKLWAKKKTMIERRKWAAKRVLKRIEKEYIYKHVKEQNGMAQASK